MSSEKRILDDMDELLAKQAKEKRFWLENKREIVQEIVRRGE